MFKSGKKVALLLALVSASVSADSSARVEESRVSEATTHFGLNFINNLPDDIKENVVLSPLSIQNLLNMVLLGAGDNSSSEQELNRVLGYEATYFIPSHNSTLDRLRPHEAMRSVFQSILQATHLSVSQPDSELLNTNPGSLQNPAETPKEVAGHLQTSVKDGDTPLSGQVNFTLANLVLTDKTKVTLKQDYENELKTYYNVNVEHFSDSNNGLNKSAEEKLPLHERVNNWVKNKTQNQIEKLASEGDLSGSDLVMVLMNAAHFKGRWLHTFNSRATYEGTFFNGGSENGASKVKFMRQKAVFGYADFGTAALQNELLGATDVKMRPSDDSETLLTEDDAGKTVPAAASPGSSGQANLSALAPVIELSKEEARRVELTSKLNCSALMLPFSLNDGQELSMVILLPAKRDGLAELQAALTAQSLNEVYKSISEQQVQVELPKFSFEASHDAKATLLKMGLSSIFLDQANVTRMFDTPAKVDKVIHKAKIIVDESGAEAAAASMASIVLRNFIRPPAPVFVADHPFLFVIRHNRSNMPLFMGRVSNL